MWSFVNQILAALANLETNLSKAQIRHTKSGEGAIDGHRSFPPEVKPQGVRHYPHHCRAELGQGCLAICHRGKKRSHKYAHIGLRKRRARIATGTLNVWLRGRAT